MNKIIRIYIVLHSYKHKSLIFYFLKLMIWSSMSCIIERMRLSFMTCYFYHPLLSARDIYRVCV